MEGSALVNRQSKPPQQVVALLADSSLQAFCWGQSGICFPTGLIYVSEGWYPRKLLEWALESHVENWRMVLSCQENEFLKLLNAGWVFSPWINISQIVLFLHQWRSGFLRPLITLHLFLIPVLFASLGDICPSWDWNFLASWRCVESAYVSISFSRIHLNFWKEKSMCNFLHRASVYSQVQIAWTLPVLLHLFSPVLGLNFFTAACPMSHQGLYFGKY